MKKFLYVFPLVLLIGLFASCTEDDGAVYPTPSAFSVSPTSSSIEVAGGIIEVDIKAGNLGWSISTQDAWCKISKLYGSGDATVILTIASNDTDASRTGVVEIRPTFDQEPVLIHIIQN